MLSYENYIEGIANAIEMELIEIKGIMEWLPSTLDLSRDLMAIESKLDACVDLVGDFGFREFGTKVYDLADSVGRLNRLYINDVVNGFFIRDEVKVLVNVDELLSMILI